MENISQRRTNISGLWKMWPPPGGKAHGMDPVVGAFLEGMEVGVENRQRNLADTVQKNMDECSRCTEQVYLYLLQHGFHPENAFLKINGPNLFEVMICVPEDEVLDESFLDVYGYTSKLEREVREASGESLYIGFSFLDFDEKGYNAGAIRSDGYVLTHEKRHEA